MVSRPETGLNPPIGSDQESGRDTTALHFSIEGRLQILMASDIAARFNFSVVLANSVEYR